jgi:hypothetical protein
VHIIIAFLFFNQIFYGNFHFSRHFGAYFGVCVRKTGAAVTGWFD